MTSRPVYIPNLSGIPFVRIELQSFDWSPGFAVSQKQKSIRALHQAVKDDLGISDTLEISSKSLDKLGISLSSFNLEICTKKNRIFTVECAYQASKRFEFGGPYLDILNKTSHDAKKDTRLRNSGKLLEFWFFGEQWALEPKTAFYDWLYLNALRKQPDLVRPLLKYSAFTDIEFNPEKSISCQARSAALFVSLDRRGLLEEALFSKTSFLEIIKDAFPESEKDRQRDFSYG